MIIRPEKPSDIETITEIARVAYKDHSFTLQTEHLTIKDLRDAGALSLSLVTEIDGRVVGHIAFSPVTVSDGTPNWYGLGPVSVLPEFQGRRIGTAMINSGLSILRSMKSRGCALVGLPTYHERFGFRQYPQLKHEDVPQEIFLARPFYGIVPRGAVEFHQAFKQLSLVEKNAISDIIIDYEIEGLMLDRENPAIDSILRKKILTELPGGRWLLRPAALAEYDSYFGKVAQFRATEMSRVHKNPVMAAIRS